MKRPILALLAAAILSLGLLGSSPAQAAASNSPTAVAMTPAHDNGDDEHGHKYSHPHHQGGTRVHDGHHDHDHDDHDDDHDGRNGHDRRRRCSGLIVICLV